ncbi:Transposable element Tcb1 transposase [Labeo rohita]|uniref:Transposable element Tcb1 transposase n=1 Tax=Labeo rohita TaxID=84645 RepID=A0ABQ8LA36_LABRO|nr:Transposable element Tcb1 transposase [Labeo rohita]
MGKTADLTVVQKTTIDTLHKEGKTQKVIAKEAGCSQSSVSKHITREAKGRKRCGRKSLLNNRQRQKWAKDKKDWTAAEWSKVMFSDESKFCISFGNQGPESGGREERHRIHVA